MAFMPDMTANLCMAYVHMLMSMTLTLMQDHSGLAEEKISFELSPQLSKRNMLVQIVSHDLDFENIDMS